MYMSMGTRNTIKAHKECFITDRSLKRRNFVLCSAFLSKFFPRILFYFKFSNSMIRKLFDAWVIAVVVGVYGDSTHFWLYQRRSFIFVG